MLTEHEKKRGRTSIRTLKEREREPFVLIMKRDTELVHTVQNGQEAGRTAADEIHRKE